MAGPRGFRAVVLIGLVSLFGDFVYEGGRSVVPDLMRQLGLTAVGVGLVVGVAELAGWVSRPLGGLIADRIGRYDFIVRAGYLSLFVVPLMAFSPNWYVLAALVFLERISRGLRIPARDALLARTRGEVRLGSAFGIHEFLDQFGAMAGPVLLAVALALYGDVRTALLYSFAPYAVLVFLTTKLPKVSDQEISQSPATSISKQVYIFTLAASLNVAGLLPLAIILYKVSLLSAGSEWLVPTTYALAMATDAAVAIPLGRLYDRHGLKVVGMTVLLGIVPAALILGDLKLLLVCAGVVGVVIGAQESIFRANVARIAGTGYLGAAYGVFGLGMGIGYAIAGAIYGALVDSNAGQPFFIAYALTIQLVSLTILIYLSRHVKMVRSA